MSDELIKSVDVSVTAEKVVVHDCTYSFSVTQIEVVGTFGLSHDDNWTEHVERYVRENWEDMTSKSDFDETVLATSQEEPTNLKVKVTSEK
jgi:hypothetical protein